MFKIRFSRVVQKYYDSLHDEKLIRDIDRCLSQLEQNPFSGKNIKKLKGQYKGYYRITTDGYRIVYRIEKGSMTVNIVSIGPRGDIYK
ncbi:MAG: type II toxin-antitoxin system RelE/ParE family toxin [Armatimonadetes bacterium]|nr:type II toxin-antitoxin system RelE/ParE family toxin [Armatimonadota bacterium]